ncbi:ApeA N-terminal domain 1-containing protein [Pseudomonas capeferrum]
MELDRDLKFDIDKSYDIDVTVTVEGGVYFGRLKLSPENITLRISGDLIQGRTFGSVELKLDFVECAGFSKNYLLYNLHCVYSQVAALEFNPDYIRHIEIEYVASYALIFKGDVEIFGFKLFSPVLQHWIGYTEKQDEIVRDQVVGKRVGIHAPLNAIDSSEFNITVDGLGDVGVAYNIRASTSVFQFNVGVNFPPYFQIATDERVASKDVMELYQKAYSFLSILHGSDFPVERIQLISGGPIHSEGLLYYSQPELKRHQFRTYSFFPLGNKPRLDTSGLPKFPLDSMSVYFSPNYAFSEKWSKYLKYRRMLNVEERFLGYFRLLESLTFITKGYLDPELLDKQIKRIKPIMVRVFGSKKNVVSFLSGIPRFNNSKYNTAKCILEFYKKIPVDLRKYLRLTDKDIESVCKLRNDISHANEYFEAVDDMHDKCDFIEGLLMIALLQTIDIPVATAARMIERL